MNDQQKVFLADLVVKADEALSKSENGSNVHLELGDLKMPARVDDLPLMFIGCRLLPNIMNYLLNILPQFLYPYVVAYLQDLSNMSDDPITINELYNYLKDLNHGNIFNNSETESQEIEVP